jgi:acyl CoA:acetate/3-ketoacid CoA transferase
MYLLLAQVALAAKRNGGVVIVAVGRLCDGGASERLLLEVILDVVTTVTQF